MRRGKDKKKARSRKKLGQRQGDKGDLLKEMGLCGFELYKQKMIMGKGKADFQNLDILPPMHPDLSFFQTVE